MNRKLFVVFVCALVVAACIGYLAYRALGARGRPTATAPMADIVVAARNLGAGALIAAPDVKMAKWFGAVPKGVLTRSDGALNRGVVSPIYEGEPILSNRLAAAGSGAGLAALISPGMRAFAVKVDEVVGVSGFVTPGMRVDVLMSGIPPGESGTGGPRSKTLMQNIQVLSAGPNLQKDSEGKPQVVPVVNLLVTPQQAEALSLASNQAHIQLVLRNPMDSHVATTPGAAMSELFGVPAPLSVESHEHAPKAGAEVPRVEIPRLQAPRSGLPGPVISPMPAPSSPPLPVSTPPPAPRIRIVEVLNGTARTEAHFEFKEKLP